MDRLWTPWRMEIIKKYKPKGDCIFCTLLDAQQDSENLILHRAKHSFVILNKYPYNTGHVMIVPLRHTADYPSLTPEELSEVGSMTQHALKALQDVYKPEGYNIGMNLGASGGAGIRDHLHTHIVPRWVGDTNFMPLIAETKPMPELLSTTYSLLKPFFNAL